MSVLAERNSESTECVRLNDAGSNVQVRTMESVDDIGSRDVENLVASLEVRAAEVVRG